MVATTIAPPARPSSRKFIFRLVVAVLVLLLIVFLGFDFWFYRAVRAALPQVDGTIHLSGLANPVIVTYDPLGVPNISAANLADLFFAQGYITAQDRLWQMDMTRRYASGELSAVLGPEYIKIDREQRILGLRQVAEKAAANMLPAQRAHFEAYAAGVNAYIAQHQKTLPLEFRFLTYFPHVWTVEDSVLVGLSMTEFLNHGLYKDKLQKEKFLAKLGPELTADLFVNTSWRDHPPGAEGASIENEIPAQTTPDEEEDPAPHGRTPTRRPEHHSAVVPFDRCCYPERGPAQERIKPAFGLMRGLARVDGPLYSKDSSPVPSYVGVLRLRARPTRKGSGSERPGGRSAQDDSIRVVALVNNPGLAPVLDSTSAVAKAPFMVAPDFAGLKPGASTDGRTFPLQAAIKPDISSNPFGAPEGVTLQDDATEDRLHPGSNNWVVSGAHTASGKPLLSNDMHLDLRIPNVWYEAHLTAGDFDVAGVTLPGVPFVIVGHNRYIAWGFTNLGPNVEDVFIEKFNDQGEYLTPQGWAKPEHRKEIIEVKGKPEVNLDVLVTRHGPLITDIVPGEKRQLALKWAIYDPQVVFTVFFGVDSAKNWQEFRAAFSRFGAPGQNVVYADVDGHIGYQATGAIPIRTAGDGSVPVPGDDDSHEWTGYVPFDQLPSVYDPPSGMIATANGRITPAGYPNLLSIEWMGPYRTERIYKLLNTKKKFTPPDMLAIQTDILSEFDRYCAERFVYAVDTTPKASQRARQAVDLMRNWDGTMTTDSAAPTVAYFSRKKLEELLLRPELGDEWKEYRWFMSPVWLENVLAHQPPRWLPEGYANYDELLTAAVQAAVDDAGATRALGLWKWGRVHRVNIQHPFWSHFPILKKGAGPGSQPLSGDGQTVKQVGIHLGTDFGPSERLTVDFSDLDNSTLNIVNGQSGNIFAEHYNDQWNAYYNGRTFALPFSQQAVQRAGVHHLRLEP
jgi:acyl-homoserine lactone acylase PvdQ